MFIHFQLRDNISLVNRSTSSTPLFRTNVASRGVGVSPLVTLSHPRSGCVEQVEGCSGPRSLATMRRLHISCAAGHPLAYLPPPPSRPPALPASFGPMSLNAAQLGNTAQLRPLAKYCFNLNIIWKELRMAFLRTMRRTIH